MFSNELTKEMIDGLATLFRDDILMIILSGSVARREETSESDVYIAIIIDKPMDMLDKWGNTLPFYKSIKEEGIVSWKVA